MGGDEDEVVAWYATDHPDFPAESTPDQSFSGSQFDAYRSLGEHIGLRTFEGLEDPSYTELQESLREPV